MQPLIQKEVEQIVGDAAHSTNCRHFNLDQFASFTTIWRQRHDEAVTIHKRRDLTEQAESVIQFAERSGHVNLKLFVCVSEQTGRLAFLYNSQTQEFLQLGERRPF